ncbi:hypothetical protein [Botrimarina sp.]
MHARSRWPQELADPGTTHPEQLRLLTQAARATVVGFHYPLTQVV